MPLYGIDISHANKEFNIHQAVDEGNLSFIALKGTEGHDWVDPTVVDRYSRITEYLPNILVIIYHYLRTDSPAADQMINFYRLLKQLDYFTSPQTLAPAIDAERGLAGQEPSAALLVAAQTSLTSLSGSLPGKYSDLSHLQGVYAGVESAYDWGAAYRAVEPDGFDIWQDTDKKILAGEPFDHNIYYGTVADMREKCGR